MSRRDPATPKERLVIGAISAALGAFIVFQATGFFPKGKANAPMWVVVAGGLTFVFAGIGVMFGAMKGASEYDGELPKSAPLMLRALQLGLGLFAVLALALVGSWVAFGPGERQITGSFGFWSGPVNEYFGRAMFGFGAIVCWLLFLFAARRGIRKLLGRETAG